MTNDEMINALINYSERLNQDYAVGTPLEITYSFKQTDPSLIREGIYSFTQVYDFQSFNEAQKEAVRSVLAKLDAISGLEFREVESGGILQYGLYSGRDGIPEGIPNDGESLQRDLDSIGADIWINHTESENLQMASGQMGYFLLLHETGHALGLKHPGNYNGFESGPFLTQQYDNVVYTMMSYNGGLTSQPGELDALALGYIYGADGSPVTETIQATSPPGIDDSYNGDDAGESIWLIDESAFDDFAVPHLVGNSADNAFEVQINQGRDLYGTAIFEAGEGVDTLTLDTSSRDISDIHRSDNAALITLEGDFGFLWLDTQDIERIQFTDTVLAFDTEGHAGQVYRLYQAAFDRMPDSGGLGYWIRHMDEGYSLTDVASGFIYSDEFRLLYGENVSDEEYTEALYQNVLNRQPDSQGFQYWTNRLASDSAMIRQEVLIGFSESPENKQNVADQIASGISYDIWNG